MRKQRATASRKFFAAFFQKRSACLYPQGVNAHIAALAEFDSALPQDARILPQRSSRIHPLYDWLKTARHFLVPALIAILFFVGTARRVSPSGSFAYGCDAFGYQRQAELISSHGLLHGLDTRIQTPDATALIAVAKGSGVPPSDWQRILGPHCHHVDAHSGRIIAQYPPGTPLVLSIFKRGTAGYGAYLVLALGTSLAGLLFLTLGTPSSLQMMVAALSFIEACRYFFILTSWASFSVGITAGLTLLLTSLLLVQTSGRVRRTMFFVVFGALAGCCLLFACPIFS